MRTSCIYICNFPLKLHAIFTVVTFMYIACLTSCLLCSYLCVSAQKCSTHSDNKRDISSRDGETGWIWKWVWSPSHVLHAIPCIMQIVNIADQSYCCPVHKRSFWPASNESHEARVRLHVCMQKVS